MPHRASNDNDAVTINRRDILAGAAAGFAFGAANAAADEAPGAKKDIAGYTAIAMQLACDPVNKDDERSARIRIAASLERYAEAVKATASFMEVFSGWPVKLVVLPEYFLTGFPLGESAAEWQRKAVLDPNGREYARLARIAQDAGVYLAGNAYESDPNFPELYFQACFIFAPSGELILRYRRLISLYTPTPYDVWDRYLDAYGPESIFPVVDTEIGRLACIASEEILYPELARCLAMRGAEVFCHPSSEVGSVALTPKDIAKRARAIENLAYVVSANTAGLRDIPIPESSTDGMSKVVGPHGEIIEVAGFGESKASAKIDIPALRAERGQVAMGNLLARQPFQLYHESYRDFEHLPANTLNKIPAGQSARGIARQRLAKTIERIEAGETRKR